MEHGGLFIAAPPVWEWYLHSLYCGSTSYPTWNSNALTPFPLRPFGSVSLQSELHTQAFPCFFNVQRFLLYIKKPREGLGTCEAYHSHIHSCHYGGWWLGAQGTVPSGAGWHTHSWVGWVAILCKMILHFPHPLISCLTYLSFFVERERDSLASYLQVAFVARCYEIRSGSLNS